MTEQENRKRKRPRKIRYFFSPGIGFRIPSIVTSVVFM